MSGYKPLEHKAAGHEGTLTDDDELLIFKPFNQQEKEFYEAVQTRSLLTSKNDDAQSIHEGDVQLESWMPTYLGVLNEGSQIPPGQHNVITDGTPLTAGVLNKKDLDEGKKYLVLENLLAGFKKPNIMDIKLGKILYDDNTSEEKKKRLTEVSKSTTSGSLGFRICGMRIQKGQHIKRLAHEHYHIDPSREYVSVNKMFGRTRTQEDILMAFDFYFENEDLSKERKNQLKKFFLQRLQLFYNTMLNEELRLVSASLLFVYEGDTDRWDAKQDADTILRENFVSDEDEDSDIEDDVGRMAPLSLMAVIDFAHSQLTPGKGYDNNVLDGIENLIDLFDKLQ